MKTLFLYALVILSFSRLEAQQNYYDLSIGTTRYYDFCQSSYFCCVAALTYLGIEEVVGDTLINSKHYSIINWKSERIYEDLITITDETDYYRFENGILYKYNALGDSVVQYFNLSIGDSIGNYYSKTDMSSFVMAPPMVIIYDTLITFTDNSKYRIIWGDDTTHTYYSPTTEIPDIQTFMDSVLIDIDETWLLPFGGTQTYYPYKPFYFIDSLGVLYSEWNYRKMALVGVKKSNSLLYGQNVHFITNLEEQVTNLKSFELYQNYPNPFNPKTTINYELLITNYVELTVYNTLGQKIQTLVNEKQTAGNHSVKFDAGGLASGVYYYKLAAGSFVQIRKMLFIK